MTQPENSTPPEPAQLHVPPDADKLDVALGDRLRYLPLYFVPQRLATYAFRRFTRVRARWFKNLTIRLLSRKFGVDMSEAENPDPDAYATFAEFFTRTLRAEVRPLAAGDDVISSPVDGTVSQAGPIVEGRAIQAKGHWFSIRELLGGDETQAALFAGGQFTTLYLSPRDYHRIHMPLSGRLRSMTHVPGRLYSVSQLTTRVIPHLFARNERVVCLFDTDVGPMAMILVGAVNVASIETVWTGVITPPLGQRIRTWQYSDDEGGEYTIERGVEMGRFNTGSTVILLLPAGVSTWDESLRPGAPVRMGAAIGTIARPATPDDDLDDNATNEGATDEGAMDEASS